MTRRLLLVRHARAAMTAGPDLLRPLTEEGERQARAQGERLRSIGPFGRVLSSPARRCVQTAQALLEGLGLAVEPELRAELAEESGRAGLALLLGAGDGTIAVGHHPTLTDLGEALVGPSFAVRLEPATAVLLHREDPAEPWSVARVLPAP